jgi:hypothetical protein
MAASPKVDVVSERRSPTESKTDLVGRKTSARWDYGGGCATRCGMERATEKKRGLVSCTHQVNQILSIPAIVASNPGDFG